ncbi:MAG: IS5 family transposase [Nanoarchaeota archaeon]|nr:IS5 family transposase [Nanoarchaeota archaeon]
MGKIGKRWGPNVTYLRNWRKVNEEGVLRGVFYLDFEEVQNWDAELDEMNRGKRGAPFQFPRSLICKQSVWAQLYNYRAVEGITRQVCSFAQIPQYNDYSTIYRRVTTLDEPLPKPKGKKISTSTDGSGMKMNMSGEYFEEKYGDGKKKFIKVTITADPYNKDVLKVEVSLEGEGLSEPEVAEKHMNELIKGGHIIDKCFMDGAGDTHDLFDFCDKNNIEPIIKIRDNAVIDPGGSWKRGREVTKYKKLGYEKWAKEKHYGRRWPGTEGIFSAVKRIFSERVRSRDIENMCKEVKRRFWCYAVLKRYGEEKFGI